MKYLFIIFVVAVMSFTFVFSSQAQTSNAVSKGSAEDSTKITLTIGNKVIPAILYNNTTSKALIERLPVTVSLNRGPVDYCGGISPINYEKEDLQAGYRTGDLAYWIPGKDFVIFTETEETSSGVPELVIIGQISSDIAQIKALGSTIKVTIALNR